MSFPYGMFSLYRTWSLPSITQQKHSTFDFKTVIIPTSTAHVGRRFQIGGGGNGCQSEWGETSSDGREVFVRVVLTEALTFTHSKTSQMGLGSQHPFVEQNSWIISGSVQIQPGEAWTQRSPLKYSPGAVKAHQVLRWMLFKPSNLGTILLCKFWPIHCLGWKTDGLQFSFAARIQIQFSGLLLRELMQVE